MNSKKMSKPRIKKTEKPHKESVINVRCTVEQKSMLEAVAAGTGMGVSTRLLHLGLEDAKQRIEKP